MLQHVREDVIRASNGSQVPWTASSLIGSFHFKPGLETASLTLPQVPVSAGDGAVGPSGRSVIATQQSTGNHSSSNHFTASDVFTQKRSSLPTGTSTEDQQDYYPLIARAAVLAQNGDYNNSVRTLKAVLELDPQCAVALRILGLVFNLMGQHAKSITTLNRAVLIGPEDARSYYYRCLVLGPSDPSTAVEDCEASLGIDPSDSEVHLGLANALLTLGQLDRARAEAEKAIQLAPDSSIGYSLLGKVTARQGDSTDADQDYKRAIAVDGQQ
jgi:tetratricopeptide (TPR) repeat protein